MANDEPTPEYTEGYLQAVEDARRALERTSELRWKQARGLEPTHPSLGPLQGQAGELKRMAGVVAALRPQALEGTVWADCGRDVRMWVRGCLLSSAFEIAKPWPDYYHGAMAALQALGLEEVR